jgi:N-sulfoglucosamine sulfohydrolase
MHNSLLAKIAASILSLLILCVFVTGSLSAEDDVPPLNILFITVDDMSCDSVGAFGCEVPDTTPRIDALAAEGLRFNYAHVQVGNCVPSRNVMQTGLYPHNSGVEGFYQVKDYDYPILPELMRENGYFIAIKSKITHSTPTHPYDWDLILDDGSSLQRNAVSFGRLTTQGIEAAREAGRPFYLVMNISDPHKPFYAMANSGQDIKDTNIPTLIYEPEDIVTPGFLPDDPIVRHEMAHYYSSVRRADDCVGAILDSLEASGLADNTVVMFLSDHGMPLPFAKTAVYHHSTRTPWIVRWPDVVAANSIDSEHMISAVDFMPTVLDIVGVDIPTTLDGQSFAPLLHGETQDDRDYIVKEYNENSGAGRHPMRSVQTHRFCYIFNPWSDGDRVFKTATTGTLTYRRMKVLAETDPAIAARVELFDHRVVEEFYDCENDPDAMFNLIDDPEYQDEITAHRELMEDWMTETNDHALEAFQNRDDPAALDTYMTQVEEEAAARKLDRSQWRGGGRTRPSTSNPNRPPQRRDLFTISPPLSVDAGEPVPFTVAYTIPEQLGEQKLHVTLKPASGTSRFERQVFTVQGEGTLEVEFAPIPASAPDKVRFATFVGEDYDRSLQHSISEPVAVR